jgi:hypothetical protein
MRRRRDPECQRQNDGMNQQALRIDENVPLFALDFLSRVVARRINRSPPFQRFWRFGYRSRRQWDWLLAQSLRGILHRAHAV